MRRDLFLQLRARLARGTSALLEKEPGARGLSTRSPSPSSVIDLLPQQWRGAEYVRTPPVRLFDGAAEAPTAMSWLRRRASASASQASTVAPPASLLYRLFRERQVRLARLVESEDGGGEGGEGEGPTVVRVTRIVSPSRRLDEGDVVLVPRAALVGVGSDDDARPPPPPATTTTVRPSDVRSWIIAKHPDFFVLNKPAGVKVHGLERRRRDGGDPATLDLRTGVLRRALGVATRSDDDEGSSIEDGPRPVHRLDQRASGCLVVARDRDAAGWLGRAFEVGGRDADADEPAAPSSRARPSSSSPPRVEKAYLALVERATTVAAGREINDDDDLLSPRRNGTLRSREWPSRRGSDKGGPPKNAVTKYRVLAVGRAPGPSGGSVALVEFSPRTGRKHQLRRHAAKLLDAPIVGDWRYGWGAAGRRRGEGGDWGESDDDEDAEDRRGGSRRTRQFEEEEASSPPSPSPLERLLVRAAAAAAGGGDGPGSPPPPLLLHSRQLTVYRPGGPPLRTVAPLPPYWRAALRACGIEPPRG